MKIFSILLAALALFLLYSIFHIQYSNGNGSQISNASSESQTSISAYQYTQDYSDPTYNFSFKYPDGFTVTTVPSADQGGGETILVESPDKKIGIQMVISPYGSDVDITAEVISRDIPTMKVSEAQTLEIGANRKGLAFMSDNPAFGGQSREVWFVFNSNLYQISTYAKYDDFLKGLFATWQFTK